MTSLYVDSKHTVYDVYPVKNKRVLVLVDPQNIVGPTADLHATIGTIGYLLEKNAIVIVGASFGSLPGSTLNLSRKEREAALEAFRNEGGLGYTNFFSSLTPTEKVKVLSSVPGLDLAHFPASAPGYHQVPNTGKTSLFGTLSNAQKSAVLQMAYPNQEFIPCTTLPFVAALQSHFPRRSVFFAPDCMRPLASQLQPGSILVLENFRFYRNEISEDLEERMIAAEVLAGGVDVFVNDSFGTSHRAMASNVELPKLLLHGAAGQSMEREIAFYSTLLSHPMRPMAALVAGSDIRRKLRLIRGLLNRVDRIFIAGAIAFPFLVARGCQVGKGYETGETEMRIPLTCAPLAAAPAGRADVTSSQPCSHYAAEILQLALERNVDIILPVDHVVATQLEGLTNTGHSPSYGRQHNRVQKVSSPSVPPDVYIVECGTETVNLFLRNLRGCRMLFWTGMLGWHSKGFVTATDSLATRIANTDLTAVLAGHHTALVAQKLGITDKLYHISGGGIASLEFLLGGSLHGIEALTDVAPPVDSNTYTSVNELLLTLPLFAGCNSHQLRTVARKFVRRTHSEGDFLVHRGDLHVRMTLVSRGGLAVHYGEDYSSAPSRFVGKGQAIGMYEFITQAPSTETVRAALPDTVTYQLSSFALTDLLNGYPDLAVQLFQNLSVPLRILANADYCQQQTPAQVAWRNSCRTRVPQPCTIPPNTAFWEDVIQDTTSTIALQKLTMRFTPYVPSSGDVDALALEEMPTVLCGGLMRRLQQHDYLPSSILVAVLRNVVYHFTVDQTRSPIVAGVTSAVAVAPLRVWSYGIMYCDMNFKMILEEAVCGAVVSLAPPAAYRCTLVLKERYERKMQRPMSAVTQLTLMTVIKMLLGIVIFPVIYQRNFIYTQPTASRFWKAEAFRAYELKQMLLVLLRYLVNKCLKMINVT